MTTAPPPSSPKPPSPPTLLHLPPELQTLITSHLPWPDLLALKHSHPYFYHSIPTNVRQRVTWLLSRAPFGLGFPQEKVNMRTDADFCRSREIRTFLERRRWHLDCQCGGKYYCVVFEGRMCPQRGSKMGSKMGKELRDVTRRERAFWRGAIVEGSSSSVRLLLALGMLGIIIALLVALIQPCL